VQFAAGPPSQWLVTLHSGAVIELAADGYTEHDGHALFSVLADVTPDEQREVRVLDWPPAAPFVTVLVAKIPMTEVAKIVGGWPWSNELGRPSSVLLSTSAEPPAFGRLA
jgi:hypothetical protein